MKHHFVIIQKYILDWKYASYAILPKYMTSKVTPISTETILEACREFPLCFPCGLLFLLDCCFHHKVKKTISSVLKITNETLCRNHNKILNRKKNNYHETCKSPNWNVAIKINHNTKVAEWAEQSYALKWWGRHTKEENSIASLTLYVFNVRGSKMGSFL